MEVINLLQQARKIYSQRKVAELLDVSPRTVRRWETGDAKPPIHIADSIKLRIFPLIHTNLSDQSNFTFIDLFAGIGGTRLGFERVGGKCVFSSEWNKFSVQTYLENFPPDTNHQLVGDITMVDAKDVPNHDVLVAGFPCQPFSIAGVSKKASLGRPHGFECSTQGTLFFDVARIIAEKRPNAFLLENVKNLVSHDKGNTFKVITETLEKELGYELHYRVIDGQHFSPQHRERIIIVGFLKATDFNFGNFILPEKGIAKMSVILHPQDGSEALEEPFTLGKLGTVNPKYTLSEKLWNYLQAYAEKHKKAGNGFGYGLVTENDTCRTLSARYYKDGSEILISQGQNKRPRRMTPRECARLMGFPDSYNIPVSDTQAYKQFGNSVVVPVIQKVASAMHSHILRLKTQQQKILVFSK